MTILDLRDELLSATAKHSGQSTLTPEAPEQFDDIAVAYKNYPEFKKIYLDESVARSSYLKVLQTVERTRKYSAELEEIVKPKQIIKMNKQIRHEESYSVKLAKGTDQLILKLKTLEAKQNPEETLAQLRSNLAELLGLELKSASGELLELRSLRRDTQLEQTRRMLYSAFPEAGKEGVEEAMRSPELATTALARRLDQGEKSPTLGIIIKTLQKSTVGMQRRLEAEAMDLELLFFQFGELVDKNDEKLTEIEKNIASTLEETVKVIENLKEANALKTGNERRRCIFRCIGALIVCVFVWYFFGDQIKHYYNKFFGDGSNQDEPAPAPAGDGVANLEVGRFVVEASTRKTAEEHLKRADGTSLQGMDLAASETAMPWPVLRPVLHWRRHQVPLVDNATVLAAKAPAEQLTSRRFTGSRAATMAVALAPESMRSLGRDGTRGRYS